jgi:MFS family permease
VHGSLLRLRGMQALVAFSVLGFAGFCLTLASLPVYAVAGGAAESSAGVVTTVFLGATIAVQTTVPALTARFGLGPVLVGGLLAMGLPAPFYVLDDSVLWISGLSVVRGAGFAVLTVLGATLAARVAPADRRGESVGLYGLGIAIPTLLGVPAGSTGTSAGCRGWRRPRCWRFSSCRRWCARWRPTQVWDRPEPAGRRSVVRCCRPPSCSW